MGIEKVVPRWQDLEVFLQLLPRSSTGERMNPYTSTWAGVTPGDGPQEFHLVLLDNGRTATLADPDGAAALRCIRCSACLNVCPVYERVGGHAYGSVYPGPIGAVLSPQLTGVAANASLPYASTLCGACYDVCPVAIDIPTMLVHLRGRVVSETAARRRVPTAEAVAMRASAWAMSDARRWRALLLAARVPARVLARRGRIRVRLPVLSRWTRSRDLPAPPARSFRAWWAGRGSGRVGQGSRDDAARGGARPDPSRARRATGRVAGAAGVRPRRFGSCGRAEHRRPVRRTREATTPRR